MTSLARNSAMVTMAMLYVVLMFVATNCNAKDGISEDSLLNELLQSQDDKQVDDRFIIRPAVMRPDDLWPAVHVSALTWEVVKYSPFRGYNMWRKHGRANINCKTMNGLVREVKGCVDYVCKPVQQLSFIYKTFDEIQECLDGIHTSLNNGWRLIGSLMKSISLTKPIASFADPTIRKFLRLMKKGVDKAETALKKTKPMANRLGQLDDYCQQGKTRLCHVNQVLGSLVTKRKKLPGINQDIKDAIKSGVGPVRDACKSKGFNIAVDIGASVVTGLDKANSMCKKLKSPLNPLLKIMNSLNKVLSKRLCVKIKIVFIKKKICFSVKKILKGLSGNKFIRKALKPLTKLARKALQPVMNLLKPALRKIEGLIPSVPHVDLSKLRLGSLPSVGSLNFLNLNTGFLRKVTNFYRSLYMPRWCRTTYLMEYYAAEFTPDKGDAYNKMNSMCFIYR